MNSALSSPLPSNPLYLSTPSSSSSSSSSSYLRSIFSRHVRFAVFRPPAPRSRRPVSVRCSSSSHGPHSSSSSSAAGGWDDEDIKYLEAHVADAVSLFPSQGHLFMTLADGAQIEVDHVYRPKGTLLFRSRNPTIFLRMVYETELLLPIVVGEMAIGMLMSALHGEESSAKHTRPNQYNVMRDLVGSLNFEVRMVRVTQRVGDTYLARIYVGKPGEKQLQSVDAKPSDAINLAVRCNVPIFVNKDIVFTDTVTPVHAGLQILANNGGAASILDCPIDGRDPVAEELILVRNMLVAAVEERYSDAAHWRDELKKLRQGNEKLIP